MPQVHQRCVDNIHMVGSLYYVTLIFIYRLKKIEQLTQMSSQQRLHFLQRQPMIWKIINWEGGGGGWKSNKTSDVFKWGLLSLMQRSHWTRKHTSKWPLPVKSVFLASTFKTLAFTPCYTTFHSPFWRSAYRTRVHWIHVKSQSGSQIW